MSGTERGYLAPGEFCREGHRSQTQLLHQATFASNLKQAKKGQFSVFMRKPEISVRHGEWESIFSHLPFPTAVGG